MFEVLFNILPISPIFIFKLATATLLFFHLAFSFIVVRQTRSMMSTVEAQISSFVYLISIGHFFFSAFVFFWLIFFV